MPVTRHVALAEGPVAGPSLEGLSQVELGDLNLARLELAQKHNTGHPTWRGRKKGEAHALLAMSQIAPLRLEVGWLDLGQDFRALLRLRVPVPCRPDPTNELVVAGHAVLGLTYRLEAVHRPTPGCSFFQILEPREVWHANVRLPDQPVCLGTTLPAGIPVKLLVWMVYGALSMQSVQVDESDPGGVMNVEAARWWQQNMHRIPLSREPFLATPIPAGGERKAAR